jgi:asparagine synthase (glutamine-hydrolysing)
MQAVTESALRVLLSREAASRFSLELALERFEKECVPHSDAPNPVGSFSIFNRTRRVASLVGTTLQPRVKWVFSPYLDNDLFDFLSALPAELFVDHNFHTDTIRYAYPEYAHVPFSATSPATDYVGDYRRYAREVAAELLVGTTSRLLRKSGVLPRLARCLVDSAYVGSAVWLGDLSIFLTQLEEAAATRY